MLSLILTNELGVCRIFIHSCSCLFLELLGLVNVFIKLLEVVFSLLICVAYLGSDYLFVMRESTSHGPLLDDVLAIDGLFSDGSPWK